MLTLQGCTSSYKLSPLIVVYTTCTRQHSSGSLARAYLNTQVSSPGLSPIQVPSTGSPAEVSTYGPERCAQGSRDTKRVTRYTVPRAYQITAHPSGQRCAGPPAYYKHQKLLATLGQRTGGLISRAGHLSIPMCVSSCSWITNTELSS